MPAKQATTPSAPVAAAANAAIAATATTPTVTSSEAPAPKAKGTAKPRAPRVVKAKAAKCIESKVICDEFAKQVMDRYQLEDSVMASMSEVVLAVLNNYFVYAEEQKAPVPTPVAANTDAGNTSAGADVEAPAKGKRKAKKTKEEKAAEAKDKAPRKSSAYNIYVKEMMQNEQVKLVPQKEKMTMIGKLWGEVSEADREPYKARAQAQNNSVGVTDTATETATNV